MTVLVLLVQIFFIGAIILMGYEFVRIIASIVAKLKQNKGKSVLLASLEETNKELRKDLARLYPKYDNTVEKLISCREEKHALEGEIEELKADIQSRYEYEKEIHEWTKIQQQDFANLRDVAVKLEQENERLRLKLGMDSLAPSANKPEPDTKINI